MSVDLTLVTTPLHRFVLPDTMTTEPEEYFVTYAQNGRRVFEKAKGDEGISFSGHTITVSLTQEETKKFAPNVNAVCKLKIKTSAGRVMESGFFTIHIVDSLHKEIIE